MPKGYQKDAKRMLKDQRLPKGYQTGHDEPRALKKTPVEKFGRQCGEKSTSWSKVVARRVDFGNKFGLKNGSYSLQQINAEKVQT